MAAIGTKLDADQVLKQAYDEAENRIRVDAEITATVGELDVDIRAEDGDSVLISDGVTHATVTTAGSLNVNVTNPLTLSINDTDDSIKIGDGNGHYLKINPDGTLPVSLDNNNLTTKNIFNEITSVPSGITSIISSTTAIANTKLLSVDVGGTNIAAFTVYIGGNLSAKKYTFYQTLNERFDFADGLPVNTGDVIQVQVLHNRPDVGDFNANILIKN